MKILVLSIFVIFSFLSPATVSGQEATRIRALELFQQEVKKAVHEGVQEENQPFFLPRQAGTAGVLLIHGLTASPWETKRLGSYLYDNGFTVYGIRLPGHGTTPEDLARRDYEEWLKSAEAGFKMVSLTSPRVYVAGLSLGGLLALYLAERQKVAAVVALAPAFKLRNRLVPFVPVLKLFKKYSFREISPEHKSYFYARVPLSAVHGLIKLSQLVRKEAGKIDAPLLIIQSRADPLVDPAAGQAFYDTIKLKVKSLVWLDIPVHDLIIEENKELDQTFGLVSQFLERQEAKYRESEKLPGGGAYRVHGGGPGS